MDLRDAILEVIDDLRNTTKLNIPYDMDVCVAQVASKLEMDLQSSVFKELLLSAVQAKEVSVGGAQITGWSRNRIRRSIVYLPEGRMVFTVKAHK